MAFRVIRCRRDWGIDVPRVPAAFFGKAICALSGSTMEGRTRELLIIFNRKPSLNVKAGTILTAAAVAVAVAVSQPAARFGTQYL